jgi:hypothetical protein
MASVQAMSATHDITPFKKIWCDFLSYRYLEDAHFVRETIILLLLLYKHLLAKIDNPNRLNRIPSLQRHDLAMLLISGHQTVSDICPEVKCNDVQDTVNVVARLLDETPSVSDVVINNNLRFYHVQRLVKGIFVLTTCVKNQKILKTLPEITCCSHPLIQQCILDMRLTGSLKPLLKLWKKVASYDCIDDKKLLQEYIRLIIIVYNHVKANFTSTLYNQDKAPPTDPVNMMQLYETVASMPIPELLDMLDEVVDKYEQLSTLYEINNKALTWSEWLKKYWWTPPIIVTSLIAIVAKHNQLFGGL